MFRNEPCHPHQATHTPAEGPAQSPPTEKAQRITLAFGTLYQHQPGGHYHLYVSKHGQTTRKTRSLRGRNVAIRQRHGCHSEQEMVCC